MYWLEEKSEKGRHIKSRQMTLTGLFPGWSSVSGPATLARNPSICDLAILLTIYIFISIKVIKNFTDF